MKLFRAFAFIALACSVCMAVDDDATPAPKKKSNSAATTRARKKPVRDDDSQKPTPDATPPPPASKNNDAVPAKREYGPAATIAPEELAEFAAQPPRVQALITAALELTKLNLTYTYGSDDPARGGMDCSGTICCVLRGQGFKDVPRDSAEQYSWVRKRGPFFAVVSKSAESFEFSDLQPGDLMFWTGTYQTARDIPISHVMMYLGREKKSKKRVMFGSSDGRSYDGVPRWGVSVFDFKMPNATDSEKARVDFVGYGRIPGLRTDAPTTPETAAKNSAEGDPDESPKMPAKRRAKPRKSEN